MCFYLGEVSDIAYEDFGGVAEVDTEGTLNQALIIALTIMDSPMHNVYMYNDSSYRGTYQQIRLSSVAKVMKARFADRP